MTVHRMRTDLTRKNIVIDQMTEIRKSYTIKYKLDIIAY